MKKDIVDKIEILRLVGIEQVLASEKYRMMFHEVALSIYGENCLNCTGKIREKYSQIIKLNHVEIMEKSELKYKLKPGVITMTAPDMKGDISNHNLTNELAESLLERNLAYIKRFEEAPNLEALKKLQSEGVKTLSEAIKKMGKKSDSGSSDQPKEYIDILIDINGIAKTTAKKLVEKYPTMELLKQALIDDVEMDFLGKGEKRYKKALSILI